MSAAICSSRADNLRGFSSSPGAMWRSPIPTRAETSRSSISPDRARSWERSRPSRRSPARRAASRCPGRAFCSSAERPWRPSCGSRRSCGTSRGCSIAGWCTTTMPSRWPTTALSTGACACICGRCRPRAGRWRSASSTYHWLSDARVRRSTGSCSGSATRASWRSSAAPSQSSTGSD